MSSSLVRQCRRQARNRTSCRRCTARRHTGPTPGLECSHCRIRTRSPTSDRQLQTQYASDVICKVILHVSSCQNRYSGRFTCKHHELLEGKPVDLLPSFSVQKPLRQWFSGQISVTLQSAPVYGYGHWQKLSPATLLKPQSVYKL